jgi:hypothetical protein
MTQELLVTGANSRGGMPIARASAPNQTNAATAEVLCASAVSSHGSRSKEVHSIRSASQIQAAVALEGYFRSSSYSHAAAIVERSDLVLAQEPPGVSTRLKPGIQAQITNAPAREEAQQGTHLDDGDDVRSS